MTSSVSRRSLVLILMCSGMLLVLLDVTVVNVAVPAMRAGLHVTVATVQGVVAGYTVALAAVLLPAGAVGDRLGHPRVILIGLAVFGVASTGCALAPTGGWLVTARVCQGAGAALILPSSLAVITQLYPEGGGRARALGIWAGVSSLALPIGPLLGGLLVTHLGWQAVFWVNPPVVLAIGLAIHRLIPQHSEQRRPRAARPSILAMINSFALWRANAMAFGMNLAANGTLFALTLYLQSVRGLSAQLAGVMLVPIFAPLALLSPVVGRIVARYGHRLPLAVGALVAAAGEVGLIVTAVHGRSLLVLGVLLVIGTGISFFTAPVVSLALASAPTALAGVASALNNTARQVGTAVGVAAFGAIVGDPHRPERYVHRLHLLGCIAAALWLLNLVGAMTLQRSSARPGVTL